MKKLDFNLILWHTLLYLVSFLDRTNCGSAKIFRSPWRPEYERRPEQRWARNLLPGIWLNVILKWFRPSIFISTITMAWVPPARFARAFINLSGTAKHLHRHGWPDTEGGLVGAGQEPLMFSGALVTDEVGDEDDMGLPSLSSDYVRPLEGLWAVAEEVVDVDDGLRYSSVASNVLLSRRWNPTSHSARRTGALLYAREVK